jgi:hypothetical protein
MGSEQGTFAIRTLKCLFRWLDAGHRFKLYAPQAPPPSDDERHTLAICNLQPYPEPGRYGHGLSFA